MKPKLKKKKELSSPPTPRSIVYLFIPELSVTLDSTPPYTYEPLYLLRLLVPYQSEDEYKEYLPNSTSVDLLVYRVFYS